METAQIRVDSAQQRTPQWEFAMAIWYGIAAGKISFQVLKVIYQFSIASRFVSLNNVNNNLNNSIINLSLILPNSSSWVNINCNLFQ